jgi:hypothetical protein
LSDSTLHVQLIIPTRSSGPGRATAITPPHPPLHHINYNNYIIDVFSLVS